MNSVLVRSDLTGAKPRAGELALEGGTFTIPGSLQIEDKALLSGSGSIVGNVMNAGQLSPGKTVAAGEIKIAGKYTQTATGALNVKIDGTDPGKFDRLIISSNNGSGGDTSLDGTLIVTIPSHFNPKKNFKPQVGQSFRVLEYESRVGDFTTMTGLTAPPLGANRFDPRYLAGP